MYVIYEYVLPKGRYIGYTNNLDRRHREHSNQVFFTSSLSDIITTETPNILYTCDTLLEAKSVEKFYISWFNSVENGYNQNSGGSGPSEKGKQSISKHRKGKITMVDRNGKSLGSISINHPKYLSGEWKHHSTGFHKYIDTRYNTKVWLGVSKRQSYHKSIECQKGSKNSMYIPITDDEILEDYFNFSKQIKCVISYKHFRKYMLTKRPKYPSITSFRFGGKIQNLYNITKTWNLPFMVKKSYSREEKDIYFEGTVPNKFVDKIIKVEND